MNLPQDLTGIRRMPPRIVLRKPSHDFSGNIAFKSERVPEREQTIINKVLQFRDVRGSDPIVNTMRDPENCFALAQKTKIRNPKPQILNPKP